MRNAACALATAAALLLLLHGTAGADARQQEPPPAQPTLADAQREFYNGRYASAASLAAAVLSQDAGNLAAYEIRSSAIHFQIKAALNAMPESERSFKRCDACQPLMETFLEETERAREIAHDRLKADSADDEARFFLGKIDLNYVWLQLGTVGRRTGWDQYWEARKSLDAVLKGNPDHVRARVARAWIDYIVDTRMARGTRWLLGGGSKKRALATLKEAAAAEAGAFEHAEAAFALWDMLIREKNLAEAIPIAQQLARDFPENQELAAFLKKHDPGPPSPGSPVSAFTPAGRSRRAAPSGPALSRTSPPDLP